MDEEEAQRHLAERRAALTMLHGAVHCCKLALPPSPYEDKSEVISRFRQLKARLSAEIANARRLGAAEAELQHANLWRRRIHNAVEDLKGQIRVFCRVRPPNNRDEDPAPMEVSGGMRLEIPNGGVYSFDAVFNPGNQEEIFEDCSGLVQSAIDGQNVTIFAYGQTGAGKTYTMYGSDGDHAGIVPRTIREVFGVLRDSQDRADSVVTVSLVELYNNQFVDLLTPWPARLQVRTDRDGSVQVDGLTEQRVGSAEAALELIRGGVARRSVSANKLNEQSSRSHLLFTVRVRSVDRATGERLHGKILLCDLGGSERVKKSEVAGERMKEAIEINKSLTSLGDVIEAVSVGQKVVPYRNHKLTQFLQDSIGGSAKTLMFVNLSPDSSSESETLMSLKYATRAKRIVNAGSRQQVEPPGGA